MYWMWKTDTFIFIKRNQFLMFLWGSFLSMIPVCLTAPTVSFCWFHLWIVPIQTDFKSSWTWFWLLGNRFHYRCILTVSPTWAPSKASCLVHETGFFSAAISLNQLLSWYNLKLPSDVWSLAWCYIELCHWVIWHMGIKDHLLHILYTHLFAHSHTETWSYRGTQ